MNKTVKSIYDVLLYTGFEKTKILYVGEGEYKLKCILILPPKKDLDKLIEILPNLKMSVNALDAKIGKQEGKKVEVIFGKTDLSKVPFKVNMINKNSLKVSFMSAFGMQAIDFMDGASCHMLNGGRTRMGKTTFVYYMLTSLYFQNKGKIKLFICSSKITDFYPFEGLPNVEFAEDETEMRMVLEHVKDEYEERRKWLKTPELKECIDAKGIKKQRPDKYHLFQPIFLLIDEYADYSKIHDIQESIKMIVRKAGYVNIHLIVCTQRADARSTIPPDIKANLGARICFSTVDSANSLNILDVEGAEKLGGIEGRAILLDGDLSIIQIPYMSYQQCKRLLKPFKERKENVNQSNERSIDHGVSEKVQNMLKESAMSTSVQRQQQSDKHMQQGNEKIGNGWFML
jgi:DNA segregation ATPase FtsK/SpoIIIE-like protein